MKKSFLFLFAIFFSLTLGHSQDKNQKADNILNELITKNVATGAVAGYSKDGKTVWTSATGHADKKNNVLFQKDTKTRIASITKSFTAIAVMQLVEKGLVDINASIQTYVPNFPKKKRGTITVKHLLEHSSGLGAYKNNKERETKKEYPTLTDAMSVFKSRKLEFKPGTNYAYTTYGYVVLGLLIENVSGKTYAEYIEENIFRPAGMKNTHLEKYGVEVANKSALYSRNKKGIIKEMPTNNLSNRIPAGGYYSTVDDLLAFGNAVLEHKLIEESTLQQMTQNNGLKKEGNPQGFGWFLYGGKENTEGVIGHSGGQTGSSTQILIIPSTKRVVVTLANTSRVWPEVFGVCANVLNAFRENK